jgi:hypothetical protein
MGIFDFFKAKQEDLTPGLVKKSLHLTIINQQKHTQCLKNIKT